MKIPRLGRRPNRTGLPLAAHPTQSGQTVPSPSALEGAELDVVEPPLYVEAMIADFEANDFGSFFNLGYWGTGDASTGRDAAQRALAELTIAEAQIGPDDIVLDVASGFGGLGRLLAERGHRGPTLSVDLSFRSLSVAATKAPGGHFVQADACHLPIASHSIDTVVSLEAMMHFSSRARFFSEVSRVLKPSGRLVTTDILFSPNAVDAHDHYERLLSGFGPWPEPSSSPEQIRTEAQRCGLHRVRTIDLTDDTKKSYFAPVEGSRPYAAEFSQTAAAQAFVHLHLSDSFVLTFDSYVKKDFENPFPEGAR